MQKVFKTTKYHVASPPTKWVEGQGNTCKDYGTDIHTLIKS